MSWDRTYWTPAVASVITSRGFSTRERQSPGSTPAIGRSNGRATASAIVDALTGTGFRIDAFEEPRPPAEYETHEPERYETAMERPDLLCVRARPRVLAER